MNRENFERWCTEKEKKLKSYGFYEFLAPFFLPLLMFFWIFLIFIFRFLLIDLLQLENFYNHFSFLIFIFIISLGTFLVVLIFRISKPIISRIEFTSCFLNKICRDIELYNSEDDKRNIVRNLKILKNNLKFQYQVISVYLFIKENNYQKRFFELLYSLPNRIYYSINHKRRDEINLADIKLLAYYLYTDSDQKDVVLQK